MEKHMLMLSRILGFLLHPLLAPLNLLLRLALYRAKKQAERLNDGIEEVEMVDSEVGPVPVTVRTTRKTELDFLEYRSPTYLETMTWGVAHELAALILRTNHPQSINEDILVRLFTETVGANKTEWDEKRQCYVVDFRCFRAGVWEGYYQDVLEFEFNTAHGHYAVIDRTGIRYTPDHPNWTSCLLHVMCSYTIFVPSAAHNWIHFAFPDTLANTVYQKLPKNSLLYQLLAPHSRFTNRINHQALWIQKSTDNYPDPRHNLVPWLCVPMYGERFREGVFYNAAQKYKSLDEHCSMPERLDMSIPYFVYLKAYFEVIEKFIQKISPYLEEESCTTLSTCLELFFPGFKELDIARVLSIFIWQVGIWHLTDHLTYFPYAQKYGFTELRRPITAPFSLSDVSCYNRYCVRNFLNTFVMFNPNPKLDQRLLNINRPLQK